MSCIAVVAFEETEALPATTASIPLLPVELMSADLKLGSAVRFVLLGSLVQVEAGSSCMRLGDTGLFNRTGGEENNVFGTVL